MEALAAAAPPGELVGFGARALAIAASVALSLLLGCGVGKPTSATLLQVRIVTPVLRRLEVALHSWGIHERMFGLVDVQDAAGDEARKLLGARLRRLRDPELRALARVVDALALIGS